jgi:mono/diheme cytochrome c family protein
VSVTVRIGFGIRSLAGVVGVMLAAAGAGAGELPAGPGREIVARECQACHDLDMVFAAAGATRDDWNGALDEMDSYGMKITPEERAQILEYLATYLGPSSKSQ